MRLVEIGEVQASARTLGLDVIMLDIRRSEDIAPAFERLKGRAHALYVSGDPLVVANRDRINTLAAIAQIPAIYNQRDYVEIHQPEPSYQLSFHSPFTDMSFIHLSSAVLTLALGFRKSTSSYSFPIQSVGNFTLLS